MITSKTLLSFIAVLFILTTKAQVYTKVQQVNMAVNAGPKEIRENATVLGYSEAGELITLRKGSNNFICISDNPGKPGFEVVCYPIDLEPFMKRSRELTSEGKNFKEKFDIRANEVEDGKLKMPDRPATLHILSGKDGKYDPDDNGVSNVNYRYVIYIPFATQESTGLSLSPNGPGHPWLMDAGTFRAHIMITPKPESGN